MAKFVITEKGGFNIEKCEAIIINDKNIEFVMPGGSIETELLDDMSAYEFVCAILSKLEIEFVSIVQQPPN